MLDATFDDPDLTTFTGLNTLGLCISGQRLEPDRAVLACRLVQHPDAADAAAARAALAAPSPADWLTSPSGTAPPRCSSR